MLKPGALRDTGQANGVVVKPDHELRALLQYKPDEELILSLKPDTDLVQSMTELAAHRRIYTASFTAIGALKRATLGYYDQKKKRYREIKVDSPHELAGCVGNISLKDGQPFAHIHVVLADAAGNTRAGHLLEGIVFVAEVHLRKLEGPRLERKYDEPTGLWLWSTDSESAGNVT